ncbi:hypothetical protein J3F83DRAFT_757844 [Trichoderma novae-zelandiae]
MISCRGFEASLLQSIAVPRDIPSSEVSTRHTHARTQQSSSPASGSTSRILGFIARQPYRRYSAFNEASRPKVVSAQNGQPPFEAVPREAWKLDRLATRRPPDPRRHPR